jgi:predicted regulator of Ras-like GTPase activity (Roadblock/LC7/MglB family)
VTEALHRDPALIEHGTAVLREMRDLGSSLVYAVVLTDDGFEVVHLPAARFGDTSSEGRLASMASSIQGLSEAVTRELGIGDTRSVTIASDHGHVVQLRVPGHPLVLAALFDDDETLGKALALTRRSAEKLADFATTTPSVVSS